MEVIDMEEKNSFFSRFKGLKFIFKYRSMAIGLVLVTFLLLVSLLAPFLSTHDPTYKDPNNRLSPPSREYFFGTDNLGEDVYSRTLYGGRLSFLTGFSVMFISGFFGTLLGLIAGYYRRLDFVIMRVLDGFMAFPSILLAISLTAVLGGRLSNVIIALSIVYTPSFARVIRSAVLIIRETEYVEASKAIGASSLRIIFRHILPNSFAAIIVQGSYIFAQAVILEAALSFLGAGVPPWIPTWGSIMSGGRPYMTVAPWIIFFPGIFVILAVLGLNLFGDGLRDIFDPRLRGVRGI
ncbi:ABC transporter permease [Caldisericum sp.]|uniref:ABC transporter permease n=1 Tax=Caldisericum sp. TaxID=2499687 RepID=UPI003D0C5C8C